MKLSSRNIRKIEDRSTVREFFVTSTILKVQHNVQYFAEFYFISAIGRLPRCFVLLGMLHSKGNFQIDMVREK